MTLSLQISRERSPSLGPTSGAYDYNPSGASAIYFLFLLYLPKRDLAGVRVYSNALFIYMRYGVTVTTLRVDAPVNVPRHVTDAVLDESSISTANCCVARLTVGDEPPRTVL